MIDYHWGKNFYILQSVDSTNNYIAKRLNETKLPNGSVIMAQNQHAGRGQSNHEWASTPGQNITASVYYEPLNFKVAEHFFLNMAISNAIHSWITEKFSIENCHIKWPNDIYINSKKIGGLLIENKVRGEYLHQSIIGIGININQTNFSSLPNATSVKLETEMEYEPIQAMRELVQYLKEYLQGIDLRWLPQIHQQYQENLLGKDKIRKYLINEQEITAKLTHIDENGKIYLKNKEGIFSGNQHEVKFIIP